VNSNFVCVNGVLTKPGHSDTDLGLCLGNEVEDRVRVKVCVVG